MSELRWTLLEKYGLIGIKAPRSPPSRYTAGGKESAAWRQLGQEAADWQAIAIEQQKRIAQLTQELVRVAAKPQPSTDPLNRLHQRERKRRLREQGKCPWCGKNREAGSTMKLCAMCAYKNREQCRRYQRRQALRRGAAAEAA
jgi:hypothetical protein